MMSSSTARSVKMGVAWAGLAIGHVILVATQQQRGWNMGDEGT